MSFVGLLLASSMLSPAALARLSGVLQSTEPCLAVSEQRQSLAAVGGRVCHRLWVDAEFPHPNHANPNEEVAECHRNSGSNKRLFGLLFCRRNTSYILYIFLFN